MTARPENPAPVVDWWQRLGLGPGPWLPPSMPEESLVNVPLWVWVATLVVTVLFFGWDIWYSRRHVHEPSMREAALYLAAFVSAALLFGVGVGVFAGFGYGGEFLAGWLTEYSLSIDNLFIFLIILTRLQVPREYQRDALLIGIVLALVMRGVFIAVGATLINAFAWVFYLFGAFLVYTAITLIRGHDDEDKAGDGRAVRLLRRTIPSTEQYHGVQLSVRADGRRLLTPMAFVIVALGTTDLLFALDSIPAIYGLTQQPYLVLTANVFALMGLRQLYFLIGGLLKRLVYLSYGLAVLLAFIGVKLILHALHENNLPFLNGGRPLSWAPDVPTWVSLVAIVAILAITTVLSLIKTRMLDGSHDTPEAGPAPRPAAHTTAEGEARPHR